MVVLAQLVEHRVVVPRVAGSSPVHHPSLLASALPPCLGHFQPITLLQVALKRRPRAVCHLQACATAGKLSGLNCGKVPQAPQAVVAQLVEHILGKDEVKGSSPFNSSSRRWTRRHKRTEALPGREASSDIWADLDNSRLARQAFGIGWPLGL